MADSPEMKDVLKALEHPALKTIDLSLGRMQRYLQAYGNPQLELPPVIHVAGTNGKGSTIAFIRAILEGAGYCCHVYTSPHLVHFRERIVIAGQEITDDTLLPLLRQTQQRTQSHPLTFFEATTAVAFEAFAATPADFTLLEVGMGGRFDATNVIPNPALSIITPVSIDHTEFLGDTLAAIAHEKAGIIKSKTPLILATQQAEAEQAIKTVAQTLDAPIITASEMNEELGLQGAHQRQNAATAITAIHQLQQQGYTITNNAIISGLQKAQWPARLQPLKAGNLVNMLPAHLHLWLDGGHNIAAAEQLAQWVQSRNRPVHLICGMVSRKDAAGFLTPLAAHISSIHAIEIEGEPQSMSLNELIKAEKIINKEVVGYNSLEEALAHISAVSELYEADILIAGSLYLAGKALEKNG